jgi:hypothetical protein
MYSKVSEEHGASTFRIKINMKMWIGSILTDYYQIATGPRQHSDFGSESHRTHGHILLYDGSGSLQSTTLICYISRELSDPSE